MGEEGLHWWMSHNWQLRAERTVNGWEAQIGPLVLERISGYYPDR